MAFWDGILRRRAEDWTYSYLSEEQVPDEGKPEPVEPNSAYISIILKSARVVHVRKGLSRFYGTVHSFASVPHLSAGSAEFQVVTTPADLRNVDASRIDRVVQLDQRLLGPVPYRGGSLELEVGLFSIKSVDLAEPYISLLESMSKVAGVAFMGTALPFVEPLKTGVDLLLGSNDSSILEIGLASSAWEPQTGYLVVMRASRQEIDVANLRVRDDDFRLVNEDGSPVGEHPYMVLKVEASSERWDFASIPDVSKAFDQLRTDVQRQNHNAAEESFAAFRITALTSPDLLPQHARKLVAMVKEEYEEALGGTLTARAGAPITFPRLEEIPLFSEEH